MKKFKLIYLTILLSAIFSMAGGMFLKKQSYEQIAFAQNSTLPTYSTFYKYDKSTTPYTRLAGSQVKHADAVFLTPGQVLLFELANPDEFDMEITSGIDIAMSVNGLEKPAANYLISAQSKENSNLEVLWVKIEIDLFKTENPDQEGKYQITLSYQEQAQHKTLNFFFYAYQHNTYFTGNYPKVTPQHMARTTTGSTQFYRTFEFNYNNNYPSEQRLHLPTITFDTTKFELAISKSNFGQTQNTYISKNASGQIVQTNSFVMVKQSGNNAVVTFNDIGAYTINYIMIYKSTSGQSEYFANINSSLKHDRLNIFGLQAYHADINNPVSSAKKEFKVVQADHTIAPSRQSDITYSQINSLLTNDKLENQYNTPEGYVLPDIDTRIKLNGKLTAQTTNQAPVEFSYNASLITQGENRSFYLKLDSINQEGKNVWTKHFYNGHAFTDVGTYLVKITYESTLSMSPTAKYTQWFYFTISNQIPNYQVTTDNGQNVLTTGAFTKQVVEVYFKQENNPFNSASSLKVYTRQTSQGAWANPVEVGYDSTSLFSQNGLYMVEMSFGKGLVKKDYSYFTIDNTDITGLIARNVKQENNNKVKGDHIDFYTNQDVVLQWNEKTNNQNKVTVYYKFIPLTQLSTPFTNAEYIQYYNQKNSIPVQYKLSYNAGNNLSQIPYNNTLYDNVLPPSKILSQQGLYLVKAEDQAGNQAYTFFMIDKTAPVILQRDNSGNYLTDYSKLNLISNTATILWGRYKVINASIDVEGMHLDTWLKAGQTETDLDYWLWLMLRQKANTAAHDSQSGDFKTLRIGNNNLLHFAVEIDTSNVTVVTDDSSAHVNVANLNYQGATYLPDEYGMQVDVIKNGILYEQSYTFFVSDESNKGGGHLASHSVTTSTDISQTELNYLTTQQQPDLLSLHKYEEVYAADSIKKNFYIPINTNTLQLQFLTSDQEALVEIDTITVNFYPYISNYLIYTGSAANAGVVSGNYYTLGEEILYTGLTQGSFVNNQLYTLRQLIDGGILNWNNFQVGKSFVFAKQPTVIEVYNRAASVNLATFDSGRDVYVWDVNKEIYFQGNAQHERTAAGKYEVVRKYVSNPSTISNVDSKSDFMTRHRTVIVERNHVISDAVQINLQPNPSATPNYAMVSPVGNAAFIQVLAGKADPSDPTNYLTDIYTAKNFDLGSRTALIETNKLPVRLAFPVAKFGQLVGNNFVMHGSNLFYSDNISRPNINEAYINNFEMALSVTHVQSAQTYLSNVKVTASSARPSSNVNYIALDNGMFLIIEGVTSNGYIDLGQDFTRVGEYQVNLSLNNKAIKGENPSLTFYFKITSVAPDFKVLDSQLNPIAKETSLDVYYLNKNSVRILWEDPTNPYLAKINKQAIRYFVGAQSFAPTKIETSGDNITHWFDLDTSAYADGTTITVRVQYEGDQADYGGAAAFSKQKEILIDRTAPTNTLNSLIEKIGEQSLLNAQTLREGHASAVGYSKTITTGNFKNFSFAVDAANLSSLLTSSLNTDADSVYFRATPNKHNNPAFTEFDPQQPNALLQITDGGQMFERFVPDTFQINNLLKNTYYEIAEIDKAGNIAVYSVYLTDINNLIATEQSVKQTNPNYHTDLADEFRTIAYTHHYNAKDGQNYQTPLSISQAQNNVKIFAKQFFKLDSVNAYGYQWFILAFGSTRYIASPYLDGKVFKVTTSGWQEVDLATQINLLVAPSNYLFTLKNMPTANINVSVVVSNNKLLITAPSNNNAQLVLTQNAANNAGEFVKWRTVEIWEYQSAGNYSAYAKFNTLQLSPISYNPEQEGFDLATYQTTNGVTTFDVNAKQGAHYRYKIIDNFGEEYILYHMHGQQYIEKIAELGNGQLITDSTIDNQEYYISTHGFKYTFYPAITTSLVVEVMLYDTITNNYVLVETYTYSPTNDISLDYGTVQRLPSYVSLLLQPSLSLGEFYNGSSVTYKITATTLAPDSNQTNTIGQETHNFKVYSLTPKTVLKGKNRQDLSQILLQDQGITSEPITIEFASTANFDYPVSVYLQFNNNTPFQIQSGQEFSQPGTYIITKVYQGAMSPYAVASESFSISDAKSQFYSVVQFNQEQNKYVQVERAAKPYSIQDALNIERTEIIEHYIVNTSDWKINLDSSQFMKQIKYEEYTKNKVTTYVRTLSNFDATQNNKSINYHQTVIAITYIPKANKIVNNFYYLDSQANQISLVNSEKIYSLVKDEDASNTVRLYWNNYHLIPENTITASIVYGQDKQPITASSVKKDGNNDYITLSRSGNYSFTFTDQAGNVHKFDYSPQIIENTTSYEFVFLNSVIITVNGQAPIQNAIFNNQVQIALPASTWRYYDSDGKPTIKVLRNNEPYTPDYKVISNNRTYLFTQPGFYQVVFSAKANKAAIKEETYSFQIVKQNELTWAFEVGQYGNYYIEKIVKNNIDVTNALSNNTLGATVVIQQNGTTVTRLKNILISLYDEQTGPGNYTITVNTNNDLNQTYTFSFNVSTANPPIAISHKEGSATTDVITVSFNARNLYDEVGDAIVKVGTRTIQIDEQYFESSSAQEVYNINIVGIGETYIQIFTPSGRLIYTYRVTRNQPLNTVAILVIVATSLAVAGLTVMFILLRKRMKIR